MKLAILILALLLLPLIGQGQTQNRFEFNHQQMGTEWKLIFYHSDSSLAKIIAQKAFEKLDHLNTIFSDYDQKSEIRNLTAKEARVWHPVSSELCTLIVMAQNISKKSKGAFDITVGPLSKLWRRAFRRQEFPNEEKIKEAKSLVHYKQLKIRPRKKLVKFQQEEMQLDLGGIAKGFSVDLLAELLIEKQVHSFLIDGGGDLRVGAAPPGKQGWQIVFPNEEIHAYSHTSIASSGSRYRYLNYQDKRYSHIIDPRTGYGVTESKTITVISDHCWKADAWASAFSVFSNKERKTMIKKLKGLQIMIN